MLTDFRRRLSKEALRAPITSLRLSKKTEILQQNGVSTVGALIRRAAGGSLRTIPSIGRKTIEEVEHRLSVLERAVEEDGSIRWERYAKLCGLELVPHTEITTGPEFITAFQEVVSAILRAHSNPIEHMVLTERLLKRAGNQKSLEEIAQAAPVRVTRERVRQLQERLLSGLSDALLYDEYDGLQIHFRKSFADFWKLAANQFGDRLELDFDDFLSGLQGAWGVDADTLLPNLPLIISILTSKAIVPQHLRPYPGMSLRLLAGLDPALLATPVTELRLQKVAQELEGLGVQTIGDLIEAARTNRLPNAHSASGKKLSAALSALADALDERGQLDWEAYAATRGLAVLPLNDPSTAEEFIRNASYDLEQILATTPPSLRAAEIFRIRTSLPKERRITLQEAADLLKSHGPSVKREETILLEYLHRQLVENDFTEVGPLYRAHFLGWWSQAADVYFRNSSTYGNFCSAIAREWEVPFTIVAELADPIWAVLSRYPHGRRPNRRGAIRAARHPQKSQWIGGTIILRGFRRAH